MTVPASDDASNDVERSQSNGETDTRSAPGKDIPHSDADPADPELGGDGDGANNTMTNGANKNKKKMETLEIDGEHESDESFDDDEMDDLLGGGTAEKPSSSSSPPASLPQRCIPCRGPEKVGNMRILLPQLFYRTGWGIAGPHWFGPFCVVFLIGLASHYFIAISMSKIGPITAAICTLFATAAVYNLVNCAYRDPGVVKLQPSTTGPQDGNDEDDQRLQFRWCDRCQVFQPVDGAHCSDCNVCIAGFDHHCVWMGTCIGKNNFKQFVAFNISWLLYLIYAITWVSVLGPLIFGGRHHPKE